LTGHSLGGALAGICAFDRELLDKQALTGVVTFGQPRFADPKLCQSIDRDMQGKFLRLINNQDPVARMPPSFEFCGVALWFKPTGVERSIPSRQLFGAGPSKLPMIPEVQGPKAMTQAEFQQFKNEVRRNKEEVEFDEQGRPLMKGQLLKRVEDHDMEKYLRRIEEQIGNR